MLTVQQVYDMAINIMNEQDDSTGATDSSELDGYKNRALPLINVLVSDLYNLSDNTSFPSTSKPVPDLLTSFDDGIDLDDRLTVNVLPYGLAGHLYRGENDTVATYFLNIYNDRRREYVKKKPTAKVAITNVYGSFSRRTDGSIDNGGEV